MGYKYARTFAKEARLLFSLKKNKSSKSKHCKKKYSFTEIIHFFHYWIALIAAIYGEYIQLYSDTPKVLLKRRSYAFILEKYSQKSFCFIIVFCWNKKLLCSFCIIIPRRPNSSSHTKHIYRFIHSKQTGMNVCRGSH